MPFLESRESLTTKSSKNERLNLQFQDIDKGSKFLKPHQVIKNDLVVSAYQDLYIRKALKDQIALVIEACFKNKEHTISVERKTFLDYCCFAYCYFSWERINVEVKQQRSDQARREATLLKSDIKTLTRYLNLKTPVKVSTVSFITDLKEPFNLKSTISIRLLTEYLTEKHKIALEGFLNKETVSDLYVNRAILDGKHDETNTTKISSFKNPLTQAYHDCSRSLDSLLAPLLHFNEKRNGNRQRLDFLIGYILFLTGFCPPETALLSDIKQRKNMTYSYEDFDISKLSKWIQNNRF